ALIGGETAEMPGLYAKGDFDLAGFSVGAVERGHVLPHTRAMREGDVVIGVASSGLHSNGYSLVRRVVADAGARYDAPAPFDASRSLAEALLVPTRLYVKAGLEAIRAGGVKGFAHITGAGIAPAEMLRTFNCGLGFMAVVDEEHSGHVIDAFQEAGDKAWRVGALVAGDGEAKVVYRGALTL